MSVSFIVLLIVVAGLSLWTLSKVYRAGVGIKDEADYLYAHSSNQQGLKIEDLMPTAVASNFQAASNLKLTPSPAAFSPPILPALGAGC